jgi:hypothetical protein
VTPPPAPPPLPPGALRTPPVVVGVWETFDRFGNESIYLRLNQPIAAGRFLSTGYFSLKTAGPDGVLGTADDGRVGIATAGYDAASRTVVLSIPRAFRPPVPTLAMLDVSAVGIVNAAGVHLAGQGDVAGVDFRFRLLV